MAILRNVADAGDPINYATSAAFLCCASMVVLGLFGFYAKIKVASKSKDDDVPVVCISGAYRSKREDFFENGNLPGPPKKITPSMVTLPLNGSIRPSQSTNDMREPEFRPVILNKSTPDISMDPRGSTHNEVELRNPRKKDDKVKKKLDKKRQDEQKAREKAAQDLAKKQAKEKAKQDKERAKIEKEQAKLAKSREKKGKAPPLPLSPPPHKTTDSNTINIDTTQNLAPTNNNTESNAINIDTRQNLAPTNTLRSDINRSSGPPPYSEFPENIPSQASTSNVSFGKPIDKTPSSWDMVSQHRQQMARPTSTIGGAKKQMVMDLQYNYNKSEESGKDNSEA